MYPGESPAQALVEANPTHFPWNFPGMFLHTSRRDTKQRPSLCSLSFLISTSLKKQRFAEALPANKPCCTSQCSPSHLPWKMALMQPRITKYHNSCESCVSTEACGHYPCKIDILTGDGSLRHFRTFFLGGFWDQFWRQGRRPRSGDDSLLNSMATRLACSRTCQFWLREWYVCCGTPLENWYGTWTWSFVEGNIYNTSIKGLMLGHVCFS